MWFGPATRGAWGRAGAIPAFFRSARRSRGSAKVVDSVSVRATSTVGNPRPCNHSMTSRTRISGTDAPEVRPTVRAPSNQASCSSSALSTRYAEPAPASSLSLAERLLAWVREFIQFGLVGATAFIVDAGLFNLLQHGPLGILAGHPNTAQFVAAVTATLYSWIANRLWTYRGRTRENATREAILFFFANACGIGISQFCLLFAHHILGFTSALADNIAVYVVGFALGTAFRFFFYHYVVFTGHTRA